MGRQLYILNPIGSAGDVHPYIAIGTRLRERGHDVLVVSDESFRTIIESSGLEFVAVGVPVDWHSVAHDRRIHRRTSAWKEAMRWGAVGLMREVYSKISQRLRPGHTLVASPLWSLGARNARDRMNFLHVSLVLNPFLLRSRFQSPIVPMMYLPDWMPMALKRWQYFIADHAVTDPVMLPETNQFRKELRLSPVRRIMKKWWFSPDLVLGLFDEFLVPRQPDWPTHVELVGHPTWDPEGDSQQVENVQDFLETGPAPVLFVPGSVGAGSSHFWQTAIDACERTGQRGLFLTRFAQDVPPLPDSIAQFDYVAMRHVIHHCQAIVHSGCIGTLSHALNAGVPQIVRPVVNDQLDNAARLERLGIGQVVSPSQFSAHRLASSIQEFAHSQKVIRRCQVVSSWTSNDPVSNICDEMEYLFYRTSQQPTSTSGFSSAAMELLRTENRDLDSV